MHILMRCLLQSGVSFSSSVSPTWRQGVLTCTAQAFKSPKFHSMSWVLVPTPQARSVAVQTYAPVPRTEKQYLGSPALWNISYEFIWYHDGDLHFPQLLTWKWNHEFKDSMDFTQVLNPLTFAAVTLISSNFPWKRASSSACQPSEAAPSWDGSASSVYMFSAQIQRFAECTCNCCVFAPLITCAS